MQSCPMEGTPELCQPGRSGQTQDQSCTHMLKPAIEQVHWLAENQSEKVTITPCEASRAKHVYVCVCVCVCVQ